jgi:hypothetical protein
VEIDETKIGKRKYNTGRWNERTWVLGMIEMAAIDWRYAQITSVITRLSSP